MKKILLTGSNGLLGQKLVDKIKGKNEYKLIASSKGRNRYPVSVGYEYEELDITDQAAITHIIAKHRPDFVIHTAAMTNVDQCEQAKEDCDRMNIDAVKYLIEAAEMYPFQLIHLSTDFIFDGENGPYQESDHPNPLSYYGLSKLKAEELLLQSNISYAILRTIIVYGIAAEMSRSNIVLWAKEALEKGNPLKVVNDQYRMPTLAEDLADACILAVEHQATGIFHISGPDYMSIVELVRRVARYFKLDESIIQETDSTNLNQAAKRPARTGFILDKARKVLGYQPHSFEEGLAILEKQLGQ